MPIPVIRTAFYYQSARFDNMQRCWDIDQYGEKEVFKEIIENAKR
jgi:hypothetical protein